MLNPCGWPLVLGAASLAAWLYLTFLHAGARGWSAVLLPQDLPGEPRAGWPGIVAIVPARDEAEVIRDSVRSLLDQDYPGDLRLVLVDDQSSDGTAELARRAAARHPRGERLQIVTTPPLPEGWMGKVWAMHQGVRAAQEEGQPAFWLFTDADIHHSPDNLRRLVTFARCHRLLLTSLMVRLAQAGGWDRLLIPAFVYFFQKLFPFPRVNDPGSRIAAAAGGCMLVAADGLRRAGGLEAIRGEVIDDCALARALKQHGPIWLGLTTSEHSLRPYGGLRGIWNMVARSAYSQLRYSPFLLVGTVCGMTLLYLVPPALALTWPWHGDGRAAATALAAWGLMAWTFQPALRIYRASPLLGIALPLAGALYSGMTLTSAWRHWRGGPHWKGRRVGG